MVSILLPSQIDQISVGWNKNNTPNNNKFVAKQCWLILTEFILNIKHFYYICMMETAIVGYLAVQKKICIWKDKNSMILLYINITIFPKDTSFIYNSHLFAAICGISTSNLWILCIHFMLCTYCIV